MLKENGGGPAEQSQLVRLSVFSTLSLVNCNPARQHQFKPLQISQPSTLFPQQTSRDGGAFLSVRNITRNIYGQTTHVQGSGVTPSHDCVRASLFPLWGARTVTSA